MSSEQFGSEDGRHASRDLTRTGGQGRRDLTAVRPVDRRRRTLLIGGAAVALAAIVGSAGRATAAPAACAVPPREPVPFAQPAPGAGWSAPPGPTVTTVRVTRDGFIYVVDGRPTTVKGMGYNPLLDGQSDDARRARLEQDFALMAATGVNSVIGWNPAVLDGLALDVASQFGLGVFLPFDIDFTRDVRDAAIRGEMIDAMLAWVERYAHHPALRMWAVGNEVLQRSVPPVWCGTPPTADQESWAAAWSTLLVEAADAIHARDPRHPVLYREAEDAYAPWLARAVAARPAERPWLVYGVNAYTPRLAEILGRWPGHGIPSPVLVSEFAPMDAARGQRAAAFAEIWGVIRSFPAYVPGGAAYVWSTDGPEAVDRQFGLVDGAGVPVDDALDALAALYLGDDARPRQLSRRGDRA